MTERIEQQQILKLLEHHRHILLEAPPGGGKTTTLVHVARMLADQDALPTLINLPEWACSAQAGLADFLVAHSGPFQARALQASQLLQVLQQRPTVVLLNGWNELSPAGLDLIEQRLEAEERKLPEIGFLLATRGHRFRPPLANPSRITIHKLGRAQRRSYLIDALGIAGNALADEIDRNPALNELTRTPFILHEVMKLKRTGHAFPATKFGILKQVTGLFEKSSEHGNWLVRAPLHGMASSYLSALAEEMTKTGTTLITEISARVICSRECERLVQARQMEQSAEPSEILGALTDHHVLERTVQANGNLQFEHQQFQEFYAARTLGNALAQAVDTTELVPAFLRHLLALPSCGPQPRWSHPAD